MKIAKTGAAFGLTALTLASTLSIGTAASAAPASAPDSAGTTALAPDHQLVPFVVQNPDGTFFSMNDRFLRGPNTTYEEARATAAEFQVPTIGTTGQVLDEAGERCLTTIANPTRWLTGTPGGWSYCQSPEGRGWSVDGSGTLRNTEFPTSGLLPGSWSGQTVTFDVVPDGTTASKLLILFAQATSIDVYDRTAEISGYAQPGSTVDVIGATTTKTVDADPVTGEWTTTVTDLELGENTFGLEEFNDQNESTGTSEFVVDVPVTELSGLVKSTSVFAGSAVVEVTGTPGLSLDYQGREVELDRDGKALVRVDGLSLGQNTVTFQQYEGGRQIGANLDFGIMVTVSSITGAGTFDDRGSAYDAVLSGTAEAEADITVVNGNGMVTTTKAEVNGEWSTTVPAPGAGLQSFDVSQAINGMSAGSTTVTLNYGSAVDITAPRADSAFSGGTLTFRGDGQAGADIEILEKGDDTPIATTKGISNGTWSVRVDDVDGDYKHTYTARMLSQGNLVTTDTVVINPNKDEAVPNAPVEVTNPATVADGYTPNAPFTFEGKGTPGKTITVTNRSGTPVQTPVIVRADGTWSFFRANMGTSTYYLNFTQDAGLPTETSTRVWGFAPDFDSVPAPVVTVTNPANVSDGYVPNAPFTFEGTGTPGKTIEIVNRSGSKVIDPVTVAPDGTWSASRPNMGTSIYYLSFIEDRGLPTEAVAKVWGFAPDFTAVPAPVVTVTNPANIADGYTPNAPFVFRGKGTPGKTIEITNRSGSKVIDPVTVAPDGTWVAPRPNMGTSIYYLNFTQDKGLPTEAVAKVWGFAPSANPAPAPVVSLTAPANPALGYTPNTSYTFKGTGTPGSSITVVNKYGSNVQDPTTVKADGTWEWTRANMGTSIWFLSFVQDQGLPTEVSTPMITFAPTR